MIVIEMMILVFLSIFLLFNLLEAFLFSPLPRLTSPLFSRGEKRRPSSSSVLLTPATESWIENVLSTASPEVNVAVDFIRNEATISRNEADSLRKELRVRNTEYLEISGALHLRRVIEELEKSFYITNANNNKKKKGKRSEIWEEVLLQKTRFPMLQFPDMTPKEVAEAISQLHSNLSNAIHFVTLPAAVIIQSAKMYKHMVSLLVVILKL